MKKYLHFIAAAGLLIPFFVSAEIFFSMTPKACPAPLTQKKWSFVQLTASKDTGICTAYFAAGGEGSEVKNWQSSNYLNPWDLLDYTVGAGRAACQKAACTLHIGGGSGNAAGVAAARAALAARNAPPAASVPAMPVAPPVNAVLPCVR